MSAIDIGIIVFAVALAAIGWERGLIGSAMPLAGFIGGVAAGARIGPALLEGGSESPYAPAVAAAGGILLGVFLAIALDGVGAGLRARLAHGSTGHLVDSAAGAVLLATLAFAAAWVFGVVALNAPGHDSRGLREAVQRSSILVALNDAFPPSGPFLNALRRINPTPDVRGPEANVEAPDGSVTDDPDIERAAASVLRVRGSACGLGVEGSGWIAAPEIVVTNAHVVAGQDDTTVTTPAGDELETDVLHYAPRNDLAVLAAPGLTGTPIPIASAPRQGTAGAAVGYPEGGPLAVNAARLGRTGTVLSEDSYGRGPLERSMTPFRGLVRNGNSGGPVVDAEGRVITTVFATSLESGPPSGLGIPNGIVGQALNGPLDGADTGPCTA